MANHKYFLQYPRLKHLPCCPSDPIQRLLLNPTRKFFPHPVEEDIVRKHLQHTRASGMWRSATRTRTWHNSAQCNNNVQLPSPTSSSSSSSLSPASPPDRVAQWCQASVLVSQIVVPQALVVDSSHSAIKCVVFSRICSRCLSPSLCAVMSWSGELTDAVRTQRRRREWMLLRSLPADTLLHISASHLQRHELCVRVWARTGGTYWRNVEVQRNN